MPFPPLPAGVKTKVVAYLARGDSHKKIIDEIEREFGVSISHPTISAIKKNNESALAVIKNAIIEREEVNARSLLDRSRNLLGRQLKRADEAITRLEDLERMFNKGKIDLEDYKAAKAEIKMPTITEMTNVTKEMHNQVKVSDEPVKDTSPEDAQKRLESLTQLIQEGDEIKLREVVFGVKSDRSESISVDVVPDVE